LAFARSTETQNDRTIAVDPSLNDGDATTRASARRPTTPHGALVPADPRRSRLHLLPTLVATSGSSRDGSHSRSQR
jgi:hypothetical protein